MTGGVTHLISPPTLLSRRRIVKRTLGKTASSTMRKLASMKLWKCAEHRWSRTVMCRDQRSVEQSMNQSAGPSKKNMMLKMMLFSVRPLKRRGAKMSLRDTPHSPNAPSFQEKFVISQRRGRQSTHPSQAVPKNLGNFVLQLVV